MATVYKSLNSSIATQLRRAGVVERRAVVAAARAASHLSSHTRTGEHHISVEKRNRVDYLVSLVGPAAVAIEQGHISHGKWVDGIHVLRGI